MPALSPSYIQPRQGLVGHIIGGVFSQVNDIVSDVHSVHSVHLAAAAAAAQTAAAPPPSPTPAPPSTTQNNSGENSSGQGGDSDGSTNSNTGNKKSKTNPFSPPVDATTSAETTTSALPTTVSTASPDSVQQTAFASPSLGGSSTPSISVPAAASYSSVPSASASAIAPDPSATQEQSKTHNKNSAQPQSHAGEIAGGVVGALILLLLLGAGIFWFLRKRRIRTAPSAEFLTVFPTATPFTQASFRNAASQYSNGALPASFSLAETDKERERYTYTPSITTEKYNGDYSMRYP